MKTFFKELFEYHNHVNQMLADMLIEHSNEISERSIPLFSHMLNGHQIWNSRVLEISPVGVSDVRSLEENKVMDNSNFHDTLQILKNEDLAREIVYYNSRGDSYNNSVRDMLFQAANHHTHHRGQIISDLRLHGIKPMITDYIFFRR